jgi:aryl-alcohol dehydrogenase-like predicted oxidoreductase
MEGKVKKLVLGTAQLGLDYGIGNLAGKPSKESALSMLDYACENGVKIFDTAKAYGLAEELLGEFLQNRPDRENIKIITKINPDKPEGIIKCFEDSLKKIKTDCIDGCLFHNPSDIRSKKMLGFLEDLKKKGLVKNVGVSIYSPEDAILAAELEEIDYIQIPYNIFDQRLEKNNFFQLAKKNKKKVFARSIFLQGVLLLPEERMPDYLEGAKEPINRLDKILREYNLSRIQACLFFVVNNENIDYIVFGAEDIGQINEIIYLCRKECIAFEKCYKDLMGGFDDVNLKIISPNLWKK